MSGHQRHLADLTEAARFPLTFEHEDEALADAAAELAAREAV